MLKEINYKVKNTKATTTYIDINSIDKKFIFNELEKIQRFINDIITVNHIEINKLKHLLTDTDKNLPRCGYKPYHHNSIKTYIDGLLYNFNEGTQKDFSEISIKPIEYITKLTNEHLYDFNIIVFVRTYRT